MPSGSSFKVDFPVNSSGEVRKRAYGDVESSLSSKAVVERQHS